MVDIVDYATMELAAGNNALNIASFLVAVFLTLLVAKVVQSLATGRLREFAKASETQLDDILLDTLEKPIYYVMLIVGLKLSLNFLRMPPQLDSSSNNILSVVIIVFVAWVLHRMVGQIRTKIVEPWAATTESKLDDQLVPLADNTLKVGIWVMALLIAFSNLGYDILSLITGLGIGGVAVAMAAQQTLSNVFGSVTIFADQPFAVEDLVEVDGHVGVIEEVGLRTCRIRTLEGTIITIPNANLVTQAVENKSPNDQWRYHQVIGLEYGTSGEELRDAMASIRKILRDHPHVTDEHAVRFMNFGDSALELTVVYWVAPPSVPIYLNTISEVNLSIKDAFDANGWSMAFPSMSLYVAEEVRIHEAKRSA